MLRKPLLSLILALLLGGGFAFGLVRLFVLRYEVGDVYPPYSSLRADPLGTKALAEALDALPGVEVRRNFQPLTKLRPAAPVTLVYTGVPHRAYWTAQELAAFESLVVTGSRAVFTFYPFEKKPVEGEDARAREQERVKKEEKVRKAQPDSKKKKTQDRKGRKTSDEEAAKDQAEEKRRQSLIDFADVAKRWGFAFDYLPEETKAYHRHAALVEPGGLLESDLSWHSALSFRDLKAQWKVLYLSGTRPVVIERKYGDGSIMLVADSFLVSNEALRKERHPRLLARLFSGPPVVVFDEESRGLRDSPGIATLARKYRLHGVVAGLVLLAILFVWKNTVRFIPAYDPPFTETDVVPGKESGEGFINLLRRCIRPSEVFETCLAVWRKSHAHHSRELARIEEIRAAEASRPARERDPIAAYQATSRALARRSPTASPDLASPPTRTALPNPSA